MCLFINRVYHPDKMPIKLNEDLVVYKYLQRKRRSWWSPFYGFRYSRDKTYSTTMEVGHRRIAEVYQGFHAHRQRPNLQYPYLSPFKMIIPKGSLVYYGKNGDIVSNRIRTKKLKPIT